MGPWSSAWTGGRKGRSGGWALRVRGARAPDRPGSESALLRCRGLDRAPEQAILYQPAGDDSWGVTLPAPPVNPSGSESERSLGSRNPPVPLRSGADPLERCSQPDLPSALHRRSLTSRSREGGAPDRPRTSCFGGPHSGGQCAPPFRFAVASSPNGRTMLAMDNMGDGSGRECGGVPLSTGSGIGGVGQPKKAPGDAPPVPLARLDEKDDPFRFIFDGSGLGIAVVDRERRHVRANPALERMLGYDRDELGRLEFPKFTHPDDIALDSELFQELVAGKRKQYQIERRYLRKDGSTVSARLTVSLLPGAAMHAIEMIEDISAEREERIRHAATRRALETRVAELSAIHDLTAVLRDPVRPLGQVLKEVAQTLHAASRVPSKSGVRVTLGDETAEAGTFTPTSCTASAVFGTPTGPRGALLVSHADDGLRVLEGDDEQRMLQTVANHVGVALDARRTEERLARAVADGKMAVWELDFRTGELRWLGHAALGAVTWGGNSATTLAEFLQLIHPQDRAVVELALRAATNDASHNGRYEAEYRVVARDGTTRVILSSGQVTYDDDGCADQLLGVAIDATERHALEGKLLQAQKMEALGQLAGGIAHDFNNLLCVILGYGELVTEELGPKHPSTSRVFQMLRAGQAAKALTGQLLAFSRRQLVRPCVLDLNRLICGVEEMLRRLIGEDIALICELSPEPAAILADSGQIEQVLMNLVINARDAMPRGGRVTIRTSFERGGGRWTSAGTPIPVGSWVVLSILDTGIGMDEATQARVFEPFFTTKPLGSGTGLGLASVHSIVSRSGGLVAFASTRGQGTEFRVYLARDVLPADEAASPPLDPGTCRGTETILVAEDQRAVRQIVRIWLERLGYRVIEAADGQEGLDIIAAEGLRIHLLLTDIVMPRASGRDLVHAFRRENANRPVVFISGYTNDGASSDGPLLPNTRILDKPLSDLVLVRAVRQSLDEARALPKSA